MGQKPFAWAAGRGVRTVQLASARAAIASLTSATPGQTDTISGRRPGGCQATSTGRAIGRGQVFGAFHVKAPAGESVAICHHSRSTWTMTGDGLAPAFRQEHRWQTGRRPHQPGAQLGGRHGRGQRAGVMTVFEIVREWNSSGRRQGAGAALGSVRIRTFKVDARLWTMKMLQTQRHPGWNHFVTPLVRHGQRAGCRMGPNSWSCLRGGAVKRLVPMDCQTFGSSRKSQTRPSKWSTSVTR